ncbi:hypothetical protein [Rhizobium yanglingense]
MIGVTLDCQIVDNLSTKLTATCVSRDHEAADDIDFVQGFSRPQRAF